MHRQCCWDDSITLWAKASRNQRIVTFLIIVHYKYFYLLTYLLTYLPTCSQDRWAEHARMTKGVRATAIKLQYKKKSSVAGSYIAEDCTSAIKLSLIAV